VSTSSNDQVLEAIAESLGDLRQPDLSSFPEAQISEIMYELLTRPERLNRLRSRIQELSNGRTRLEDASKDNFKYLSKELGALYQRLVGKFTNQLVIIGNSTPQFLFVPHK
jgi:hypothetical protein